MECGFGSQKTVTNALKCSYQISRFFDGVLHLNRLSMDQFLVLEKNTYIRPSIKEEGLDVDDYKNNRRFSNLPFLSKILESVQRQRNAYLQDNKLHAENQSAYRSDNGSNLTLMIGHSQLLITMKNHKKHFYT